MPTQHAIGFFFHAWARKQKEKIPLRIFPCKFSLAKPLILLAQPSLFCVLQKNYFLVSFKSTNNILARAVEKPWAGHTTHIFGWLQANTAHQLAEVYEALGNDEEASSMRQEVRAKVKDVREVVDETLAKAAARSAQTHTKVDELKALVLSHWQQAQRWGLEPSNALHD